MITTKSDSQKWLQIKVIVTNDYKQKWFSQMITNKSDSHKWLQIKVIVTNDYK